MLAQAECQVASPDRAQPEADTPRLFQYPRRSHFRPQSRRETLLGRYPITHTTAGFLLAEPAYFGTDVTGLRLPLYSITNNPRKTVNILL